MDAVVAATTGTRARKTPVALAHLEYLDLFRGVAILFVVLIHASNAVLLRGVEEVADGFSPVKTALHILSHDATTYFALISGILYGYRLHRKPHAVFMRSRVKAVVVPYAIVSVLLTLALVSYTAWRTDVVPSAETLIGEVAYNVLLGEAWNTLWYIPVITLLYLISPVLLRVATDRRFFWLAAIVMVLPLVVSRTGTEVTPAMLTYFAGVYVVGLAVGVDPENNVARFEAHWLWIALVAVLAAVVVVFLDRFEIDMTGPVSLRESAFYVLRLALAALMLAGLRLYGPRLRSSVSDALKTIAAYSFGIYFIHGPLLRPVAKVIGLLVPESQPWWALLLAVALSFAAALAISMAVVYAIKRLAGSRSKLLIGS